MPSFPLLFKQYLNSFDIAYKTLNKLALVMSLISVGIPFPLNMLSSFLRGALYQLFCLLGMFFP